MKRNLLLALLLLFTALANAQCIIDSAAQTSPGIYPVPDSLPCVIRTESYQQTIQVLCPASFDTTVNLVLASYTIPVNIDSMELDSIPGLPAGLNWSKSVNRLRGGQYGCLTLFGTTFAAPGIYNLQWYGKIWASYSILGQTLYKNYTGILSNDNFGNDFDYSLNVIAPGSPCGGSSGISNAGSDLNASVSVYPNPNNGTFQLQIDASDRLIGEIAVVDVMGRTVYSRSIDAQGIYNTTMDISSFDKGLYTLQIKTNQGFAVKNILVI